MRICTLIIPYTHLDFPYIDLCPGFRNPGNVLIILNVESCCKSLLFVLVIVLITINHFDRSELPQ
jgi:hypothetical protein